jgi:hypothetical protein
MTKLRFRTDYLVILFLLLQGIFWYKTNLIKPEMMIVPNVPGEATVKALSFGDEQLYFRVLALELQNMGDTYGRFTALKNYNYKKLAQWFTLMDSLDSQSNFIPSLASYYFSQTQNKPDVRYIVDYLDMHGSRDPAKKWWWLSQAVYLSNHVLNDKARALEISMKLAKAPGKDIPLWARQMPAFIHEQLGEKDEALVIIQSIMQNEKNISDSELNFMHYFIKDRLNKILDETPKK